MTAAQWGSVIEKELLDIWVATMTGAEVREFEAAMNAGAIERVRAGSFSKLDSIIIEQAMTLGWRITLAELVRFRLSEWDLLPGGPDLFRKLGAAMSTSATILQGAALPPLNDSALWEAKAATVSELRLVLTRMRSEFAVKRTAPSRGEVTGFFSKAVAAGSFPYLASNRDRWIRFFEENPEVLRPLALGDRASPASLFDAFMAWSTGWQAESVRQRISSLKPKL